MKLKGELEDAIHKVALDAVHIMQPSMLLGDRKERRGGESMLQGSMKFLSGIFVGSLRKYRAIRGKTVAAAMLNIAKGNKNGFFRYTYDEIVKLADRGANSPR